MPKVILFLNDAALGSSRPPHKIGERDVELNQVIPVSTDEGSHAIVQNIVPQASGLPHAFAKVVHQ